MKPRGQILPLIALLLPLFVGFVGAHLKRSLIVVAKIENQREADLWALSLLTDRARALNAVAALNEGLEIARERGRAVQVALLTLEACAASFFGSPACGPALARLTRASVPFYRKLSRLGAELARMQDEIVRWAEQRPSALARVHNLSPSNLRKGRLFVHPSGPSIRLPVVRRRRGALSSGLGSPVSIPDPYVLEFRSSATSRICLARVVKVSLPLDSLLRRKPREIVRYPDLWAISEGESAGSTLTEMGFQPRLRPVTLGRPLWNSIRRVSASLVLQGFDPPSEWNPTDAPLLH